LNEHKKKIIRDFESHPNVSRIKGITTQENQILMGKKKNNKNQIRYFISNKKIISLPKKKKD
jgi:hypothetical protein